MEQHVSSGVKETVHGGVLRLVNEELERAFASHRSMASAHEGFAVLLEEVDELWEEVRRRAVDRDLDAIRAEAIQVAAMAVRLVVDVCEISEELEAVCAENEAARLAAIVEGLPDGFVDRDPDGGHL